MAIFRRLAFISALGCAFAAGGCKKSEPDLPTFDPLDKVQQREGWQTGRSIAVSTGPNILQAHHVQAIASGLHDVDYATPPKNLIPVEPSCKVKHPGMGGKKYLIIGNGYTKFPLMKDAEPPMLTTFDSDVVKKTAQLQAASMKSQGTRNTKSNGALKSATTSMQMTDIFITETSKPVFIALAEGGLYNFNMAPGVRLSGVVVYSETDKAAVVGVPEHVPVDFVSKTHKSTRECWTRIQPRPDKTWAKRLNDGPRYKALMPHWKAFQRRVRKDIGTVSDENIISVYSADHFLIGPAPTRYEDRLPYTAFAGKSVRYLNADHVNVGTNKENQAYAETILDRYYEAYMRAGKQ